LMESVINRTSEAMEFWSSKVYKDKADEIETTFAGLDVAKEVKQQKVRQAYENVIQNTFSSICKHVENEEYGNKVVINLSGYLSSSAGDNTVVTLPENAPDFIKQLAACGRIYTGNRVSIMSCFPAEDPEKAKQPDCKEVPFDLNKPHERDIPKHYSGAFLMRMRLVYMEGKFMFSKTMAAVVTTGPAEMSGGKIGQRNSDPTLGFNMV